MPVVTELKTGEMCMQFKKVPVDQFRSRVGDYLDGTEETPIVITKSGHPQWALIRFSKLEEYERLKVHDTRVTFYANELPEEDAAAFADGYKGRETPEYG